MIQHHLLLVALFGILTLLTNAQNDFIVPQYNPCIGEEIVMSCYIDNTYYYSYTVYVSFGGSQAYSPSEINDNSISGFDTSRFQIDTISSANFSIKITNYEPQDSNTVFGCHGEFIANFTISGVLASGQLLTQAKPPSGLGFILLYGSFDALSCELQSRFYISKPYSERTISTYRLYLNGKYYSILELDSYGYLVGSVYLTPGISNTLQISAVSCGGESVLSHSVTRSLTGYTLDSFLFFYLTQDNKLSISWFLTKTGTGTYDTENIGYSLQVLSKYTTDVVTQNVLNQSTTLNLISSNKQYLYDLGIGNKLGDSTVTLDITVSLQIVSLCSLQITDGTVATSTQTGLTSTESILTTQQETGVLIAVSVLFVVFVLASGVQSVYILITCINRKRCLYSNDSPRYTGLPTTVVDNTNAGGPMNTGATAPPVPVYTTGAVTNPVQIQSVNTLTQKLI